MSSGPRNHVSDLRGASRLAVEAVTGITSLVEAMHTTIAAGPASLGGPLMRVAVNGTAAAVYTAVRGAARAVGGGVDLALGALAPALGEAESPPEREAILAVLNGVLGDYLEATGNPLAITMQLRRDGKALSTSREVLAAAIPGASGKVAVFAHGLCMNDLGWRRPAHDHAARLAADLGFTPVHLRYNSGRHISTNGQAFSALLHELSAAWPVPLDHLVIVGHSMGGLVARAAHHYGSAAGHAWPGALRALVFLGTPHHGAPLERGGHWIDHLSEQTRYTAPFAQLGKVRSAGITDLRHGCLLDEDWQGHDRFARRADPRRPVPLPDGVTCCAVAATLGDAGARLRERLVGDGLVPVPSALGEHRDPRFTLAFPPSHRWTAHRTSHLGLLSSVEVYERIRAWLSV